MAYYDYLNTDSVYANSSTSPVNTNTNNQKVNQEENTFSADVDLNSAFVDETDLEKTTEEFIELAEELGIDPSSVLNSSAVSKADESDAAKELKEEIAKLQAERDDIEKEIEDLEDHIEELADAAEKNIADALAQQEEAFKDHEEESKQILNEQINAYIEANKDGGDGMSKDELQENIKSALPNAPQLADAMASLAAANDQINEIDSCLSDLNSLISDAQDLESQINGKTQAYQAEITNPVTADSSGADGSNVTGNGNIIINGDGNTINIINQSCDPIGFTKGEGDDQVKYDFIVDDGNFDSTSDFLGAQNQWEEMTALNADGDSKVSAQELQNGNIKAVKTNADGSQEIVDVMEEFGEDFSIDLDSYQFGGQHDAVNTLADSDNDGVTDQYLAGTFNVNLGDETLKGYNTLDDVNWLEDNYGISADGEFAVDGSADIDSAASADEDLTQASQFAPSQQILAHTNFFDTYTQKSAELKAELQDAYKQLGLTDEQIASMNDISIAQAVQEAPEAQAEDETSDETTEKTTEEPADVTAQEAPEITEESAEEPADDMAEEAQNPDLANDEELKDLELFEELAA